MCMFGDICSETHFILVLEKEIDGLKNLEIINFCKNLIKEMP